MLGRPLISASLVALVLALFVARSAEAAPVVSNGSFETNTGVGIGRSATDWIFAPTNAGASQWDGIGNAGFVGMTAPPVGNGSYAAFAEGIGNFSQSISGWTNQAQYKITFYGEAWTSGNPQTMNLLVDGNVVTSVTPAALSWTLYNSPLFTVPTAGTHTIAFAGAFADINKTSFIDAVSITELVPEPTSLGLLALGAIALVRRRATR